MCPYSYVSGGAAKTRLHCIEHRHYALPRHLVHRLRILLLRLSHVCGVVGFLVQLLPLLNYSHLPPKTKVVWWLGAAAQPPAGRQATSATGGCKPSTPQSPIPTGVTRHVHARGNLADADEGAHNRLRCVEHMAVAAPKQEVLHSLVAFLAHRSRVPLLDFFSPSKVSHEWQWAGPPGYSELSPHLCVACYKALAQLMLLLTLCYSLIQLLLVSQKQQQLASATEI